MALSQAANLAEKAVGHTGDAVTEQNMTNPARDREKYADPSGATMKALIWNGKNSVKVGKYKVLVYFYETVSDCPVVEAPKPKIIESTDVIVRTTGSTVCGSDLHLYHGMRHMS